METIIREVNPARLAWGTFDHAKSDYVNEGDIPASYSGDSHRNGPARSQTIPNGRRDVGRHRA